MLGSKTCAGVMLACLTGCTSSGGDGDVETSQQTTDTEAEVGAVTAGETDGDDSDTDSESDVDSSDLESSDEITPDGTATPDDAATDDTTATGSGGGDGTDDDPSVGSTDVGDDDGGTTEPPGVSLDGGANESDGEAPSNDDDAEAPEPEPDVDPSVFVVPEVEDCSGVEFVDPERACGDLGGLSLANPMLVTDDDGEWNPGDTATLHVDLVGAPRDDPYLAPGIVAVVDVASAEFTSVPWITWELFGLNAGASATHEIELTLSETAPVGATVYLHLEPATSDGNTTKCDCPGVDVDGLTLEFEVQ